MSNLENYWLGHKDGEKLRLDNQSQLLRDPFLEPLLKQAKNCLEIGCGVGSNVDWIRSINPAIVYTGIDISDEAILAAKTKFKNKVDTDFAVMDATKLKYQDGVFDLVFTKLVLWAVGKKSGQIAKEAYRTLRKGGVFHAFEPDDDFLAFYPHKKNLKQLMVRWQERAQKSGMNPLIGKQIPGIFYQAKFCDISCVAFTKTSIGIQKDQYRSASQNIKKIYFGRGPEELGLSAKDKLWKAALKEMNEIKPAALLVETYFVVNGRK